MGMEQLYLTQQMRETERNLENVMSKEQKRRERGGLFSSVLGGIGGLGGALLLAPMTGGMSLLGAAGTVGLGATAGSLLGSRLGLELGDGKRSDSQPLGMNKSVVTGKQKEFGDDVKDRYRRNVNDFQDTLNNRILSSAINTGIKSAAFNYAGGVMNKPTMADGTVIDASGNVVDIPKANIAGAQAYQPAGMGASSDSLLPASKAFQASATSQPNNLLNVVNSANAMDGLGPLSNRAYDNVVVPQSNPFIPNSMKNIGKFDLGYTPTIDPNNYTNALAKANAMRSQGLMVPQSVPVPEPVSPVGSPGMGYNQFIFNPFN